MRVQTESFLSSLSWVLQLQNLKAQSTHIRPTLCLMNQLTWHVYRPGQRLLLCGQKTTYSTVIWGPLYNADSWARLQTPDPSWGRGVPNTCTVPSPSWASPARVNVRTEQRADCLLPRCYGLPFQILICKPNPSSDRTPERKDPLALPLGAFRNSSSLQASVL